MVELNEKVVRVDTKSLQNYEVPSAGSNPIIAAMVTSYARLHLYKFLKKLDRRVVYCDTGMIGSKC